MKRAKPNPNPSAQKRRKRTGRIWQRFPGIMKRGMKNSPYYPILSGIVMPMLKRHPEFKGVVVFGSFARGVRKPNDIDLFIVASEGRVSYSISSELEGNWKRNMDAMVRAGHNIQPVKLQMQVIPLFCGKNPGRLRNDLLDRMHSTEGFRPQDWHFIGEKRTGESFRKALDEINAMSPEEKKAVTHSGTKSAKRNLIAG